MNTGSNRESEGPGILIVDCFSGGKQYPTIAVQELNATMFHLRSAKDLPEYYTRNFSPEAFVKQFIWGDVKMTELKALNLTAVIAGTESGVELADLISEELGLRSNGSSLSSARRNKTRMHKEVAAKGLRVPKQLSSSDLNEIVAFAQSNLVFPLVLKPESSAGTDSFFVVSNSEELVSAFNSIFNRVNRLGQLNTAVLVQELIDGEEFAINTVSANGVHYITHIWHYHKALAFKSKIYDWEEYIDEGSTTGVQLKEYVFAVLDALAIKFGPAHTEVMIDTKGPVLIETASRVDGVCNPAVDDRFLGTNQIRGSLISWLYPDQLKDHFSNAVRADGFLANMSLIAKADSRFPITKVDYSSLKRIPSVMDIRSAVKVGDSLRKTTDIFTSPAFIYMHSPDRESFLQDYRTIRDLEEGMTFFKER